ncbi:cytochrome c oxidase assembly protein [Methylomonas sp. MgM2]
MSLKVALLTGLVLRFDSAQAHGLVSDTNVSSPSMAGGLFLTLLWAAYIVGARRTAPTTARWLTFQIAGLITVMTLFADRYGGMADSASLHMALHLLMMVVVAPLFVVSRPLPQWLAATGRNSLWLWRPLIRLSSRPLWMGGLQGLLIWFWHAPKFYNLAVANPWWHLAEHAGFIIAAGLFWWSVLRRHAATALLSVLFTLMHTGMLGALLTFAPTPFYNDARDLQDQQLAGLIMWVPGGLAYLIAGGWCGSRLLVDAYPHFGAGSK